MNEKKPAGDYSIGSDKWPALSKLIEECGEVMQVAGKLIGTNGEAAHWDGTDLRERLKAELADLDAAIQFFIRLNGLNDRVYFHRHYGKYEQFKTWHHEQKAKST